ncbi:hypothetical protein [Amorphus sp. 3PC139-8]|uniref:hypothetical protein n=1 Tax=Amorphus sp. 3PC139-8 TaxID=2735676 RepID=UPI00345D944B
MTRLTGSSDGGYVRNGADVIRSAASRIQLSLPDYSSSELEGHYPDGGRARFIAAATERGLGPAELDHKRRKWLVEARILLTASILFFLGGFLWLIPADSAFELVMCVGFFGGAVAVLSLAFRADFAAWQIRERRFGSVREYLDARF